MPGAGLYVEPEDAKEFAEAVLKLRENRQVCKEYGENGLNFVRQNFDRGVLAGKYIQILINKVAAERKQRAVS